MVGPGITRLAMAIHARPISSAETKACRQAFFFVLLNGLALQLPALPCNPGMTQQCSPTQRCSSATMPHRSAAILDHICKYPRQALTRAAEARARCAGQRLMCCQRPPGAAGTPSLREPPLHTEPRLIMEYICPSKTISHFPDHANVLGRLFDVGQRQHSHSHSSARRAGRLMPGHRLGGCDAPCLHAKHVSAQALHWMMGARSPGVGVAAAALRRSACASSARGSSAASSRARFCIAQVGAKGLGFLSPELQRSGSKHPQGVRRQSLSAFCSLTPHACASGIWDSQGCL